MIDAQVNSVGWVSTAQPRQVGMSGFGTLMLLARLNHFHRSDFLAAFGLRFQYRNDLSKLLAFSDKGMTAVAKATGTDEFQRALWTTADWMPFQAPSLWSHLPWTLRGCATCFRHGFHSILFQQPWIARCPWHREQLVDSCRRCDRRLLDGFSTGLDLLQCSCGLDHVNELAALRGDRAAQPERDAFLTAYLKWAQDHRRSSLLLCPEEIDAAGLDALVSLIHPDASLSRWANAFAAPERQRVHVDRIFRGASCRTFAALHDGAIDTCARSLCPGPAGLADVPRLSVAPLKRITQQIAGKAPASMLSSREREAMSLEASSGTSASSSRHDLVFLPVQELPKSNYLDVRILHRTAFGLLRNLASLLLESGTGVSSRDGRALVFAALQRVLTRAYADGLTHVLGRYIPDIYDHPRIRSGPRLPWALVEKDESSWSRIELAWSLRQPWTNSPSQPANKKSTAK